MNQGREKLPVYVVVLRIVSWEDAMPDWEIDTGGMKGFLPVYRTMQEAVEQYPEGPFLGITEAGLLHNAEEDDEEEETG